MFSMINQFSIVKYAISTPAPENFAGMGRGHFFGGCFPLPGCKFNQRIEANSAKQKVPSPQRYCRFGTSSYIRMLICLRCGRRDFGGLPLH